MVGGPGFYFAEDPKVSKAHGRYIIAARVFPRKYLDDGRLSSQDVQNMRRLIRMAPDLDFILSNFGYQPGHNSKEQILQDIESDFIWKDNALETVLNIWGDFYNSRNDNQHFMRNMVKLGYDALLLRKGLGKGSNIVVYNPSIIEVIT